MMVDVSLMRTPGEARLAEQFDAWRAAHPREADGGKRDAAFARFAAAGLPHRRIEAWHYTDLRSLLRDPFAPAAPPTDASLQAARAWLNGQEQGAGTRRLVILDGVFQPSLSSLDDLSPGVTIGSVQPQDGDAAAEALGSTEAMLALNEAFLQGGVAITLDAGASLSEPLDIVWIVTGAAPTSTITRSVVRLGDHASATVLERHVNLGTADAQGNHALVLAVGHGASLDHVARVEGFSPGSLHVASCLARLGADARLRSFALAATSGIIRRQTFLEFAGEHAVASLDGVSLLDGRAHGDTTLVVTHTAAHCQSREYFKTILAGESTGVYQGKVNVAPGAQKTDGKMLSKAIFLADGASMFNKPELEIFADDVVCGHGATVGYLDENQLFYLRSRGIPLLEAQSILLNAFAADAIESVGDERMRDSLTGSVEAWLAKRQS